MPDPDFPLVPVNEFAMMTLASQVGIEVPAIELRHRDALPTLPDVAWPGSERWAFVITRFDRNPSRERVHIEDMAQVRGFYADGGEKYRGSFESVAAHYYRAGRDTDSFLEFIRRLTFCLLIGNGDAHLKNWSLVYPDRVRPRISPAYDLVATAFYRVGGPGKPEDLGLKLNGSKRFDRVSLSDITTLARRLGANEDLTAETVGITVERVVASWPGVAEEHLAGFPELREDLSERLPRMARQLQR